MRTISCIVMTFCLAMLFVVAAPCNVLADEWNQATKLTFSEPIELPGIVLPAGTYWFTLADSQSDRNIVQVWNADRTRLVTTILAIPDYRLHPTDKTVINFEERPSGSPEAIHAWFYPGDNFGREFVYPKQRATELAKQTSQPVLSMRDENASDATEMKEAPVVAVNPSGEEVEVTEVIAMQPVMPQEAPQGPLPQTASPLPFVALAGVLSLASAGVLRLVTRIIS